MKGARDRKPTGGAARARVGQPLDQDTKKISAFQLAEVLARVDGNGDGEAKAAEPRRTISGTRPIIRPRVGDDGSHEGAEATGGIDIPVEQLAPVIERPVTEAQVVNATCPVAPDMPEDVRAAAPAADAAEPTAEDVVHSTELASPIAGPGPTAEPEPTPEPEALVVATSYGRARVAALALVLVVLSIAGALFFVYPR